MKRLTYINILLMFMLAVGCNSKVCLERENNVVTRGEPSKREKTVTERDPATSKNPSHGANDSQATKALKDALKQAKTEEENELKEQLDKLQEEIESAERSRKLIEELKNSDLDESDLDDLISDLDDLINELRKSDLNKVSAQLKDELSALSKDELSALSKALSKE